MAPVGTGRRDNLDRAPPGEKDSRPCFSEVAERAGDAGASQPGVERDEAERKSAAYPSYSIRIKGSAAKELRRLPPEVRHRLVEAIDRLAEELLAGSALKGELGVRIEVFTRIYPITRSGLIDFVDDGVAKGGAGRDSIQTPVVRLIQSTGRGGCHRPRVERSRMAVTAEGPEAADRQSASAGPVARPSLQRNSPPRPGRCVSYQRTASASSSEAG